MTPQYFAYGFYIMQAHPDYTAYAAMAAFIGIAVAMYCNLKKQY